MTNKICYQKKNKKTFTQFFAAGVYWNNQLNQLKRNKNLNQINNQLFRREMPLYH